MEDGWSGRYRAVVCQAATRPVVFDVADETEPV